ncbi:MAG: phosphomannose isomerase type II C-terminal cupin domain [Vampirovibrionales bacterium]|nr:phosphomannose isomerase type II C-terminal cupin domain [Vampirovibrionales bacterium]
MTEALNTPAVSPAQTAPVLIQEGPFTGEQRPWGNFLVLRDEPHYKLKQLQVLPGQRLSLQLHHQREEHWLVTRGTPEITVGDKTWQAKPGEYIFIPKAAQHRLANLTQTLAELIEVQLGDYFGEDDIVRLQDDYKR